MGIENAPLADIKDGNCLFTTLRQQLLDKPQQSKKSSGYSKKDKIKTQPIYSVWKEPFVLHYDDPFATSRDGTSPFKQR